MREPFGPYKKRKLLAHKKFNKHYQEADELARMITGLIKAQTRISS